MDLDLETYCANTDPMLSHNNVGTDTVASIADLAGLLAEVIEFWRKISFDRSKLMNVSRLGGMGWRAKTPLCEGIADTYR